MNLTDLRRVSVKQQLRIRFNLSNGMECILNEHGVAQVPALRASPAFNLEEELAGAKMFLVEPVAAEKNKAKSAPRSYSRDEMATLAAGGGAEVSHEEHDE